MTAGTPEPIAAASGRALEGAAQEAYRAYLDHRPGCVQCKTSPFICQAAVQLWDAYKAARKAAP